MHPLRIIATKGWVMKHHIDPRRYYNRVADLLLEEREEDAIRLLLLLRSEEVHGWIMNLARSIGVGGGVELAARSALYTARQILGDDWEDAWIK